MKTKLLGVIACGALLGVSGVSEASADTVYGVNDTAGILTVNGTITTDGMLGVLASSDIKGWSLTISGSGTPFTLTGGNSVVTLNGPDLTATATTLSWNYSDAIFMGTLQFNSPPPQAPFGSVFYGNPTFSVFNLTLLTASSAAATCVTGVTVGCVFSNEVDSRGGIGVIATVPLPAAAVLFGSGLGVLGLLGRRRTRKNDVVIAVA